MTRPIRMVALLLLPFLGVALTVLLFLPARMNTIGRGWAETRARSVATVMANLVAPDLDFDDRQHAHEALATLAGEHDAQAAIVLSATGEVIAAWPDAAAPDPGLVQAPAGLRFTPGRLIVVQPIATAGGVHGSLAIALSTAGLDQQRDANNRRAALAALMVGLIGLLLSGASGRFLVRRQRAEQQLKLAETGFRALIEGMPDAIFVYRHKRLLYTNQAAVRMLGIASDETFTGADIDELLTLPAGLSEWRPGVDDSQIEFTNRLGKRIAVELSALDLPFAGSEAQVLVARDVTERKRLYERLLMSDRLASIGTLAAGVAHEINNPLTVVISNLEFLADGVAPNTPEGEALRDIADGAERIRRIVSDMKTLSRSGDDVRRPLDVHDALDKALQMTHGQIKHRAEVIREYGLVPHVASNEPRLVQIFINLLINACQALPEKGSNQTIRVTTRRLADERVQIAIADSGAGIPLEVRARIFDPFFTTKAVGVGTGLGLSICHNLVTSLGGTLHFESTVGKGTTMFVTLPASRDEVRPVAEFGGEAAATPRARVLVVDDEIAVGKAIERILAHDHEVVAVVSGAEGLARIRRGERFDLILCDVLMPTMNGLEFHGQLTAGWPEQAARVVLMTGGTDENLQRAAEDRTTVLAKPFEPGELTRIVGEHTERGPG